MVEVPGDGHGWLESPAPFDGRDRTPAREEEEERARVRARGEGGAGRMQKAEGQPSSS